MFFLLSLLSAVAIGGAVAVGAASGGGGGGSSESSVVAPAPTPWNGTLNTTLVNSYKTTEYNNQYGLNSIHAAEAYSLLNQNGKAVGGDGVKIAITDTGINLTHNDIAANNFGSLHTNPSDDWEGHGTHVSSIAAGVKGNGGVHGVAFNADLISVRVALSGDTGAAMSAHAGVGYAAQNGAKVINMSWGSSSYTAYNGTGDLNTEFPEALVAKQRDALMVAATGNDGDNNNDGQSPGQSPNYLTFPKPALPALYANNAALAGYMLAVGAVDSSNHIADFSNICGVTKNYCLVAPGVSIVGAYIGANNAYAAMSGTSMAAPHVTGAAAVIRGAWPYLSAKQTSQILLDTATDLGAPGVDDIYGHGLLNLQNAVSAQGANNVTSSFSVDGSGYDARNSSFSSNAIFGDAYAKNVAPILKNAVFFDMYGRDYKANLDQKITSASNVSFNLDNLMLNNYSGAALPFSFGADNSSNFVVRFNTKNTFTDEITGEVKRNKFGIRNLTVDNSKEDPSALNLSEVSFGYSHNFDKDNKFSFSKNDFNESFNTENPAYNYNLLSFSNFISSPYKRLPLGGSRNSFVASGDTQINSNQFSFAQNINDNLTTSVSFTNYNQSGGVANFKSDESRVFESNIGYKFNNKTKVNFGFGNLNEMNGRFLGSKASGTFTGGSDPQTKYFNFNVTRNLFNNWQLTTTYSEGQTNMLGNNIGVFRDFSDIRSRGSAIGLLNDNFLGGRVAIIYSEPLRVYKGTANLDMPVARDADGNVQRLTASGVSLKPDGKEQDLEFSYGFKLNIGGEVNFNSILQKEAGNIKDNKDQYTWMVKYSLKY